MRRLLFLSFLLSTACLDALLDKADDDEEEGDEDDERQEGDRQGDCTDGEDNDDDGDIDCDDSGCSDKPACDGVVEPTSEPSPDTAEAEPAEEPSSEPTSEPTNEPTSESSKAYITQSYSGTGVVNFMQTYDGTESLSTGVNQTAGTGNLTTDLIWTVHGTIAENPSECGQCVFTFDMELTFDAGASTDPNGDGADMNFSYALGTSDYGADTLFYGSSSSWGPWLVNGRSQTDLAGTDHTQVVDFDGTTFTYTDGIVDFYYYY